MVSGLMFMNLPCENQLLRLSGPNSHQWWVPLGLTDEDSVSFSFSPSLLVVMSTLLVFPKTTQSGNKHNPPALPSLHHREEEKQ